MLLVTAWAEGRQFNGPPSPATASAEGRQLNGAPSLASQIYCVLLYLSCFPGQSKCSFHILFALGLALCIRG